MQENHEYNSGQKVAPGVAAKKMIPTPLGQINKGGSKGSIGNNIHHHQGGASGLKLERIIGSTVYNQHSFQLHPSAIPMSGALPLMIGGHSMNSEIVAYLAGTFVVLYNIKRSKQVKYLEHPTSNKPFSCIAFSKDGQYLAAGERGPKPSIAVWDLHQIFSPSINNKENNNNDTNVTLEKPKITFDVKSKEKGHEQEIKQICFSKDSKMLISSIVRQDFHFFLKLKKNTQNRPTVTTSFPTRYSILFHPEDPLKNKQHYIIQTAIPTLHLYCTVAVPKHIVMDLDRLTQSESASSSTSSSSSSPNNNTIGFSSPKTKETDSPSELNQYAKQKLNELYLYWIGQKESQNLMYQYTESFSNAILSSPPPPLENHNASIRDELSVSPSSSPTTNGRTIERNTNSTPNHTIIGGYEQHSLRRNPIMHMSMEELAHHPSSISLSDMKSPSSSSHNAELLSSQRQNLNSSLHDRHLSLLTGDRVSLKSNPIHSPPHPQHQQQRSPHSPKIFSSSPRSSPTSSPSSSKSSSAQVLVDEVDFSVSSIQHKLSTHENHHHHSTHPHPASPTLNNAEPFTTTLHDPYGNVVSISNSLQHITPHSYHPTSAVSSASTSCSTPPKSPLQSPTRSQKSACHLEMEPLLQSSTTRRRLNFSDELELGNSDPSTHKTGLLQRKLQELQNVASNYESQKKKMKMSVDEASFSQIPRFYFPNEKSQTSEKMKQDIYKIKNFFLGYPSGVAIEQFGKIVTDICEMPSFFKSHIFMRIDELGTGSITCEMFEDYYRKHLQFDNESYRYFNVIKQQKNDFIVPQDFEIIMRELLTVHPGLRFLESTPEFQDKYMETVIIRIFYTLNRSVNGRISLRELKNSPLVDVFKLLDREQDTNNEINFFAYEHFYVLYCKFWELDTDRDGMLSKEDLMAYGDGCLTEFIVDRIMGGNGKKLTGKFPGMMSYEDFIWFCLSEEDKTTPVAQEYWFRCVDIDGDGVLSLYELEQVFAEQKERIKQYDPEISFGDVHCQIIDMLKPKNRDAITLSDIKKSKMSPVFFNILFNLTKFFVVEQKGTLGSNGTNIWAQYAKEEYQRLISEDEEEQPVDMVDEEDEMDKDDLVDEKEAWEM